MVQELLGLLKLFLEKHFIPSIIAIVAAFSTYLATSPESWLLQKLGENKFWVFSFCLWLLTIEFIIFLAMKIRKSYISYKDENYYRNRQQEENKEAWNDTLENIWTVVDEMSPRDYELLLEFVTNGNQPHITAGRVCGQGLLNDLNWVHKTLYQQPQEVAVSNDEILSNSSNFIPSHTYMPVGYQYKLKDNIYKILKYSLDNHGRISHFDR